MKKLLSAICLLLLVSTVTLTVIINLRPSGDAASGEASAESDGALCTDTDLLLHVRAFDAALFTYGRLSPTSGAIEASQSHIYTAELQKYPFDLYLRATPDCLFTVCFYENGGASPTGGCAGAKDVTIPASTPFRICIQGCSGEEKIADIAALLAEVSVTGNPYAYELAHLASTPAPIAPDLTEMKGINHTGWWKAPPNTLWAYEASKAKGFTFVECDIRFTKDGVPVLLHNTTINSTARNADGTEISTTLAIADLTLEEVREYDFGVARGDLYAGTKIPTLAEFLTLCRSLGLYPYIDVKNTLSEGQALAVAQVMTAAGFEKSATLLVWSKTTFERLQVLLPEARYGFTVSTKIHEQTMRTLLDMYGKASVFLDVSILRAEDWIAFCKQHGIPVEVWTVDTEEKIVALDPFVTGVTSNKLNAKTVLDAYRSAE